MMRVSKADTLAAWIAWRKHVAHAHRVKHSMHSAISRLREHSKAKAWRAWVSHTLSGLSLKTRLHFYQEAKMKSCARCIFQLWRSRARLKSKLRWILERAQIVCRLRSVSLPFKAWYEFRRYKAGDVHILASHKHAITAKRSSFASKVRHGC